MASCRVSWVLGLALATGCNGDGAGASADGETEADGTADTGGDGSDDGDSGSGGGSADESSDDGPDGPCGNGVVDSGEECDDGPANSDTDPDVCRADCRFPQCGDGVIDAGMGEVCDDGADNANFEPNACRTNCQLPTCGDGGVDTGESCDDGNEEWGDTCYQCSARWYFILNAPDLSGAGGPTSVIRTSRDGEPVEILNGAEYNGTRALALPPSGDPVYALQSDGATDRVLMIDPIEGGVTGEIDIAAGVGYDPECHKMVYTAGQLWIAADNGGTTRIIAVDPMARSASEALDTGGAIDVGDMTEDPDGGVYISDRTANEVLRVDTSGPSISSFVGGLAQPVGIAWDDDQLWLLNNSGGATQVMYTDSMGGMLMEYTVAMENIGPENPCLDIDTGNVVSVCIPGQDRVAGIAQLGEVQTLFDEMVTAPYDHVVFELGGAG